MTIRFYEPELPITGRELHETVGRITIDELNMAELGYVDHNPECRSIRLTLKESADHLNCVHIVDCEKDNIQINAYGTENFDMLKSRLSELLKMKITEDVGARIG